jgi:branched-chain amino acid transport system substrate-binding protein
MNKNYKNKVLAGFAAVLVILVGIFYAVRSQNNPKGGTVTLGFIAPLSGDGAAYGETERNVTIMAVDEINDAGGIDGRKINVIYEDGGCDGKDATDAIQKLISVDHVDVVMGGACSAETLAAAPIAMASHVILFSSFSSNPALTNAGDYFFRNAPSDSDVGKLDADLMAKSYKKVAILSEDTDYSQGVRAVMDAVFKAAGVTVTDDEVYVGGTTDFRTALLKIKQTNPQALYINPGTALIAGGLIVSQARELGITIPLYGNFSLGSPEALAAGGAAMNGVVISDSSGLSSSGVQLLANYKKMFGADSSNAYEMGAAYDRVFILKDAIAAVGDDPEKIKDYLHQMPDFAGAVGTYRFDGNGDVVGVGFANFKLENGREVPLVK